MKSFLIILFFVLSANTFATTDLSNFSKQEFKKLNSALKIYVLKNEAKTQYPDYDNNSVSYILLNTIISNAYASSADACFFAGWISQRNSSGQCMQPWEKKSFAHANGLKSYGPSCGKSTHIRCNKYIFGPGPNSQQSQRLRPSSNSGYGNRNNPRGGICVATNGSYSDVAKKCHEASENLRKLKGKNWIDDLSKNDFVLHKQELEALLKIIRQECKDSSGNYKDKECEQLDKLAIKLEEEHKTRVVAEAAISEFHNISHGEDCYRCRKTDGIEENVNQDTVNYDPTLCDIEGTSRLWKSNCLRLLSSNNKPPLIPKDAFAYALEGMKLNATSFKTDQCYMSADGHFSMGGRTKQDFQNAMSNGIPNKCQIMINNFDERLPTHGGNLKCKSAMYFIDLCSDNGEVKKSYSYLGYGTCKRDRGFVNKSGQGTSLLGMFLTNDREFSFREKDQYYKQIAGWIKTQTGKREIPAVALMGLQQSNNRSAPDYKYLHVGAYTSAGCPSIDKENYWIIKEMAAKGPSVVLNYKKGEMEPLNRCSR